MVNEFYRLVRNDELLAPIFLYELNTYWVTHLEKMYSFWNAALFGEKGYSGNPFAKHATELISKEHIERWLHLLHATIDTFFEGSVAEEAKNKAVVMATTFEERIENARDKDIMALV